MWLACCHCIWKRDVLALYMDIDKGNQKDIDLIEARLKEIFTDGVFTAYEKLTMIRWLRRG